MDVREKLVELLNKANSACVGTDCFEGCKFYAENDCLYKLMADVMIAHGVTVQENTEITDELLKQLRNAPLTILHEEPTIEVVQEWISVTERLPENEIDVLICAERRLFGMAGGERKTIRVIATAFHTDGKMNTEDSGYNWELDNVDMKYDEEADAYIVPEGWWEAVRYGEEFSAVDDFVTHWMPMPQPPKGE